MPIAKSAEEKFIAEGFGVRRFPVMYNDFILVGPQNDPASIKGTKDIVAALTAVKNKQVAFVSRGDRSGTHQAELALWKIAGIDINKEKGSWYREIGQGMGAALNFAASLQAYTLSDRGTWISFKNKRDLAIAVEGDKRLFNQYGVMLVNPAKHPRVKQEWGQAFIDWLISPEGQKAIERVQDQWAAAFLSQCGRAGRLTPAKTCSAPKRVVPLVHGETYRRLRARLAIL